MKKRTIPGGILTGGLVGRMKRLAVRCETLVIEKKHAYFIIEKENEKKNNDL
jgi:hypothetical protein